MKNLFVLLMMVGFVPVLRAQVYQKTWQQRYENEFTAMALTANNDVWVAGKHGVPDLLYDADATLTKLDFSGEIQLVFNLEVLDETTISNLYVLPDDGVLFCGYGKKCPNQVNGFVGRLSAGGQQLWYDVSTFTPCLKIRQASDTSVYLLYNDRIETRRWDDGTVLETEEIATSLQHWFVDFLYWEEENWFILASGPILYIIEPGVQWGWYDSTPHDSIDIVSMEFFSTDVLLIHASNGRIYNYEIGWNMYPQTGIKDFTCMSKVNGGFYFGKKDTVFTSSFYAYPVDTDGQEPKFIVANDWDYTYVGGVEKNTNDPGNGNANLWLQSYYFWEGISSDHDVSIESLWIEEMPVVDGNLVYSNVENATLNVLIRNAGTTILDEVTLNASIEGYNKPITVLCDEKSHAQKRFSELSLIPGDVTVLQFDGLGSPFVYDATSWELCVWTSMPNAGVDANHDNQLACINLDLTVSTNEIKTNAFSLFPNPTTDACTITWGENLRPERVQVYDLYGRLVRSETVDPAARRHELDLAGLIRGLYIVETGGVVVRVVKL